MDVVYEIAIVVWVVLVGWIIIASAGGRYLLRKPKNDYERKQREIQKRRDIEQVRHKINTITIGAILNNLN